MRSVAQSLFARHPTAAGVGVGIRWLVWLVAGHPFGLVVLLLAVDAGLWWRHAWLLGAAAELALGLWGYAGPTKGARSIHLWGQLCRFRRRWPAQFSRAYRPHRRPSVVSENHYSVPGGLRPVLAAPRLSVMPRAFDHRTIGWGILPTADHDLGELVVAVERLGSSDDRIGSIRVRRVRTGQLALIVRFRRSGVTRSILLAVGLGSLAEDITDEAGPCSMLSPLSPFGSGSADGDLHDSARSRIGPPDDQKRSWPRGIGVSPVVSLGSVPGEAGSDTGFEAWAPSGQSGRILQPGGVGSEAPMSLRRSSNDGTAFPLKWSFSVILPANSLLALVVSTSDSGPIGLVAVVAATVVSVLLIAAEAAAGR